MPASGAWTPRGRTVMSHAAGGQASDQATEVSPDRHRMVIACQARTRLITDFIEGESPSRSRFASISASISTARANCCSDIGAIFGGATSRIKVSLGYRGPGLIPGRLRCEVNARQ